MSDGIRSAFTLVVVLFILLIIVGCSCTGLGGYGGGYGGY